MDTNFGIKSAEEFHHTKPYVEAQRRFNPNWRCNCDACNLWRSVQINALEAAAREVGETMCSADSQQVFKERIHRSVMDLVESVKRRAA